MKFRKIILLLALVLMCLQTASAGDVAVTDADAIMSFTLSTPSNGVLDSTDAPAQDKFNDVFVHDADATLKFTSSTPSDDVLDSTDAPAQEQFNDVFVHDADATLKFTSSTPSDDVLDSTDAPAQEQFNDVFVHDADVARDFDFTPVEPIAPENYLPTANAGGPYSGNKNEPIQFYGTGTDPDGDAIIAYAWDFNSDKITDSTQQNPTYSWSSAGTYYPTLKVQDEKGAWSLPDECTVLITTPLSYDGTLPGVYPQPHYSTGETVNIGVDVKNTGDTAETYDLHLVVYDKYAAPVYAKTIDSRSVVSADDLGEFSATAYHCVYESEMAGTPTVTKTISGTTYTLKASFLFGGFGVPMQGTGRTGPSGDYIHCTNPTELSFVNINNPEEFTDEIRQRYTDLGIADFTGFGNLALTNPEQAEYSVVSGITGASGRTLTPWHSIAVDPSEIPLGTTGRLLFKSGTTPEGVTQMSFRADDTGGGIVGKHIDIYVGEGQSAIDMWYETGGNRNVEVHAGDNFNIYLSPGAKTSEKFSLAPLPAGHYSFSINLNSSSSGSVYDDANGNFKVLNLDAISIIENDAEPLKKAALDELDEMVTATAEVNYNTIIELTWSFIEDVVADKIVGMFDPQLNLFTGISEQDLAKAGSEAGETFFLYEKAIAECGEGIGLKSKLKEVYRETYTLPEECNVINRDTTFDNFVLGKDFVRDEDIIQLFRTGEEAIRNTMESGELQKKKNTYEDIQRAKSSWWFNLIEFIAALTLLAAVIFTIVSVVGVPLVTFSIPILKSFVGAISILPTIGVFAIAMAMVVSLPFVASEVTTQHDSTLDIAESIIMHQTTSTASVLSVTSTSQPSFNKEAKFTIAVDKSASGTSEPIIGIVVSPDGRIIDMNLHQTNPHVSNYETLSSSLRLPHQPGKYKILAMTSNDIMQSSVKQVETTQTPPNVSVSLSTAKQFYNSTETVTINANLTNNAPEKVENLTFSIDVLNTTCNNTGFLEIDAKSSKIETLSFVSTSNGTYKATVTLFAGLYIVNFAETGFTVENGTGVSVNIDSKDVYDPNTNVTVNLTIKNVGTELYRGNIDITTVDTLNDYQEVYNSIESLSVNESEEKELKHIILPKESSTPGIYRSYIEIDNFTYIVPFTVAANGTIFITVQTDNLIYSASESVNVKISVKDVAFNATNATLNVTLTNPNENKTYFNVTCTDGNYSTIIPPDNKSVNGTYNILVNGAKDGYRVYSDQTFFIVNERTKLRCDIPRIIKLNTTDTINLFVKSDTNQSVKDAFVMFTGCGFNETRTTDENGLVVFGTGSVNKTGVIDVSIEKGGHGSFIGKVEIASENQLPVTSFTYTPENPIVNQTVTFDATTSYDPDGNITSYDWNFGDGNTTNTTEKTIIHLYASEGDYNVNLTVTDDEGAMNSTSKMITINPLRGDLDRDGRITPADAAIALRLAVGGSASCDPTLLAAADVSGDGSVTSLDALMILQAAAGSIEIG